MAGFLYSLGGQNSNTWWVILGLAAIGLSAEGVENHARDDELERGHRESW
jgi:hypothetical protein